MPQPLAVTAENHQGNLEEGEGGPAKDILIQIPGCEGGESNRQVTLLPKWCPIPSVSENPVNSLEKVFALWVTL